jgi:hypothetical protein
MDIEPLNETTQKNYIMTRSKQREEEKAIRFHVAEIMNETKEKQSLLYIE